MSEITVHLGDSRDVLKTLADNSIDSVVTDPPYALVSIGKRFGADNAAPAKPGKSGAYARASAGFMGKKWDTGETAFAVEFWAEVMRVLKPGGHVVAFSGTRTYHRLACAVEDAGFEIRDMVAWIYGSGFPKSHDVSKGIDKAAGAVREKVRVDSKDLNNPPNMVGGAGSGVDDRPWRKEALERGYHEKDGDEPATDTARQWQGWGTALKPALEPVVLARKPLSGTVSGNVLAHGVGALNIDASRIGNEGGTRKERSDEKSVTDSVGGYLNNQAGPPIEGLGRWPANLIHDGSEEVLEVFPTTGASKGGLVTSKPGSVYGNGAGLPAHTSVSPSDSGGSVARFFYTAKADATERLGTKHPTVKPTDLMAYLIRLVTPPGGTTLDPFAGSGSTGVAAVFEGFNAVLIEREPEYHADILRRIAWARGEGGLTMTQKRIPAAKIKEGDLFADDAPPRA